MVKVKCRPIAYPSGVLWTILDDVLELETQKFAFQLISGWGIQKWSQFFDILEI